MYLRSLAGSLKKSDALHDSVRRLRLVASTTIASVGGGASDHILGVRNILSRLHNALEESTMTLMLLNELDAIPLLDVLHDITTDMKNKVQHMVDRVKKVAEHVKLTAFPVVLLGESFRTIA